MNTPGICPSCASETTCSPGSWYADGPGEHRYAELCLSCGKAYTVRILDGQIEREEIRYAKKRKRRRVDKPRTLEIE